MQIDKIFLANTAPRAVWRKLLTHSSSEVQAHFQLHFPVIFRCAAPRNSGKSIDEQLCNYFPQKYQRIFKDFWVKFISVIHLQSNLTSFQNAEEQERS